MGKNKSKAYRMEQMIQAISRIKNKQLRVYGAMTLYLATRSGELLPYKHYHYRYEKNADNKTLFRYSAEGTKYAAKREVISTTESKGIDISTIQVYDNRIELMLPVFKCKRFVESPGYIYKKNNPFFEEIKEYIMNRKALFPFVKGPVYLFQATGDVESYFNSFRKKFIRALQKEIPGAKIHSLRKTMATHAAEISKGNIFFVKSVTRHRTIGVLSEYVEPVLFKEQFEKYLEGV